jgi:hypothetical protein
MPHKATILEGASMAEYQEILKFLASNPPHLALVKKFHASLLEILAKKLRDEASSDKSADLKTAQGALAIAGKYH